MSLKFRIFKNITKQGFQSMWRNRGMGLASVSSITAVLMILGVILILILSINNIMLDTKTKFDEVQVFLADEAKEEDVNNISDVLKNSEGVVSVTYESKKQALEILRKDWDEDAYLLEGLEDDNPLPNSYIIKLKDIKYAKSIVDKVSGLAGVENITYYQEIIDKLMVLANYIRFGGLAIIGVLVFVSVFIISNTIKLTVTSRKREINIMKYVGATNNYIRGPFIIEGILLGLCGALISILIVYYGYGYLFDAVNEKLYSMFTFYLIEPKNIFNDIAIMFATLGVGIGALGSIVSLKRFLNV